MHARAGSDDGAPAAGFRRILSGRRRVPAHLRSPRQQLAAAAGALWDIVAFAYLAVLVATIASRRSHGVPPVVLQPLQSAFPLVLLPLVVVAATAVLTRRSVQAAVAIGLGVVGWLSVRPALTHSRPHATTESTTEATGGNATTWTVFSANLLYSNTRADAVAAVIAANDVDLVSLQELSPAIADALERAGLFDRYPYRIVVPRTDPGGGALLSKYPIDDRGRRRGLPSVTVNRPAAEPLQFTVVHASAPVTSDAARAWLDDLVPIGRAIRDATGPALAVGDFNASRWQPAFGALLAAGALDAHEAAGLGLSRSWSPSSKIPLLMRLDHALGFGGAQPVSAHDVVVPGSDHRGFVAAFSVSR